MTRRLWTQAEEQHLRDHYAHTLTADIAAQIGRSLQQVRSKAHGMGLHKTPEFLSETARDRTCRPGHGSHATRLGVGAVPWNKGITYSAGGRSAEHRFRPGCKPHTWLPVGSYRVIDGTLEMKINDLPGAGARRWKAVHRLVWEATFGAVAPGHVVAFKPGRKTTDCALITLDALELVTRVELMRRNSHHINLPPELARVVQLRGVLTRAINNKTAMKDSAP